jgi:RNA polymerase sigma factor (sigma-70 family)
VPPSRNGQDLCVTKLTLRANYTVSDNPAAALAAIRAPAWNQNVRQQIAGPSARVPPAFRFRIPSVTEADLAAVFHAHRLALLRFLRARGAGADAEDLLHDLWLRISTLSDRSIDQRAGYLFGAASNLLLERRSSTATTMRRDHQWAEMHDRGEGAGLDEPGSDQVLIAREALDRVQAVIEALGPRAAHAFRRFRLDGAAIGAVAQELGVSRSTVEKDLQKVYRALLALRESGELIL